MVITIQDYALLSEQDKKKVKRNELQQVIDNQLALMNNEPNKFGMLLLAPSMFDKKFEQLSAEVREAYNKLHLENNSLRKAIMEQQKIWNVYIPIWFVIISLSRVYRIP